MDLFFGSTETEGTRQKYWKRVYVRCNATLHHSEELKALI